MYCCNEWKSYVDKKIKGGFDSRKHPLFVKDAITNAEQHYLSKGSVNCIGTTEVFKLAKHLYPMIEKSLKAAKAKLNTPLIS